MSTPERPPKSRSACNTCHKSKVRCTGEKSGCSRCETLNVECHYSISMVGKVPGLRSKNRQNSAPQISRGPAGEYTGYVGESSSKSLPLSESISTSPISPISPAPPIDWEEHIMSPLQGMDTNSTLNRAWEMFSQDQDLNMMQPPFEEMTLLETNIRIPLSEVRLDDAAVRMTVPDLEASHIDVLNKCNQTNSMANGNRGIHACCEIIDHLETQLSTSLCALDEVMELCRSSVVCVASLIEMDEFRQSICFPTFGCMAMHMIISLLESCTKKGDLSTARAMVESSVHYSYTLPRIRFGTFHLHSNEEMIFYNIILQEQIGFCFNVVARLRQQRSSHMTRSDEFLHQVQEQWCSDLERRLMELAPAIEY